MSGNKTDQSSSSSSSSSCLVTLCRFVRLMTVEPYLLLFMIAHIAQKFAQDQLLEDKLCVNRYGLPRDYCAALPRMSTAQDNSGQKSAILAEVTQITMMINIIITIPTVLISLFIGQFIDQYRNAKKVLLIAAALILTLETLLLFLNSFFFWLDYRFVMITKVLQGVIGAPATPQAVIWAYTSAVTPIHLRGVRMSAVMVFLYGGIPIGSMLSGMFLNQQPLFPQYEIRNYSTVYFISMFSSLLAFVAALVLVDEQRDCRLYEKYFPINNLEKKENQEIISTITTSDDTTTTTTITTNTAVAINGTHKLSEMRKATISEVIVSEKVLRPVCRTESIIKPSPWKILTNLSNIALMFKLFVRWRPHQVRLHLYLSMAVIGTYEFCWLGIDTFVYPYAQHMFNWNTGQFSIFQAMCYSTNIVTSILLAPIILKIFSFSDLTMSLVALTMVTMQNLVRTISIKVWIFRLSIIGYSLNSLTTVGFRSYISNIVRPNELGSIFSLLSIVEAIAPLFSSIALSTVFSATIDTMPTLSFAVLTSVSTIGLILGIVVRYQSRRTLEALQKEPDHHSIQFPESTNQTKSDHKMALQPSQQQTTVTNGLGSSTITVSTIC